MADPVSTFLRRAGQEAATSERAINLARTALKDAIHFGRPQAVIDDLARKLQLLEGPTSVQIEVPRQALDPVSVEYAAIGGPRAWAEERVMNAAGNSALESADGPTSEVMDALRSNALTAARLARMTPEQRAQSVAAIAFQAADDARAAKMAQAAARERQKVQSKALMDALGSTALATTAGALTAGGIGAVAMDMKDRAQREQNALSEYRMQVADRTAKRNAIIGALNEQLGQMTDQISFDPGVDDISGMAAEMANEIRGVPSPEPDIFTEDPQIKLDSESQQDAIRRILAERYGR